MSDPAPALPGTVPRGDPIRRRGVRALVWGAALLLAGVVVNRLWRHLLTVNIMHTVGTFLMLYGYYVVFVRRPRAPESQEPPRARQEPE